MGNDLYNVDWSITQACNFKCEYCHVSDVVANEKVNVGYVLKLLENTGKQWTFTISGGEPTIHPRFISLCTEITKKHKLRLNTNLSKIDVVRRFTEVISPASVDFIDVSFHYQQRIKRDSTFTNFKEGLRLLRERGYNFKVNYVLFPSNISNLETHLNELNLDSSEIIIKRFKGVYNLEHYPLAYDKKEKELFKDHFKISRNRMDYNYKGVLCNAGKNLIKIRANGDVFRCPGDKTRLSYLGNINDENVELLTEATVCNVTKCPCWGPANVVLNSNQSILQLAIDSFVEGDYESSEGYYKSLLKQDENPIALNNLGVIKKLDGRLEEANNLITKAYKLLPLNAVIKNNFTNLNSIESSKLIMSNEFKARSDLRKTFLNRSLSIFKDKIVNEKSLLSSLVSKALKNKRISIIVDRFWSGR